MASSFILYAHFGLHNNFYLYSIHARVLACYGLSFYQNFSLYFSLSKDESLCISCLFLLYLCLWAECAWVDFSHSPSGGDIIVNNFNENIWCINITNLGSQWWGGRRRNKYCKRSKWGPNGAAGDVFLLGEQMTGDVWSFLMGMRVFKDAVCVL